MLRFALFLFLAWAITPAAAFGAGNIASIAKIEGKNWRHGDIEDILLSLAASQAYNGGKKFSKLMIKQTYFGNWARDYSQAVDVGTVKSVSSEAIRLLLCVLGFMTFGYGSGEFEVTADRLGCYRPEEHIDNPKGYAEGEDARNYDRRLRGPIDEERELSIDPETGMKNYIANERAGIMTSAKLVKKLFGRCIELGRKYREGGRKSDLHESLRLLGTGLHCLEDFFAHSNYVELALTEMGERDIFPHCGQNTEIRLEGAKGSVYPITTGTFGGVDFLHSVTGEVSDKLTQNEIDELEGTLQESSKADTSMLRDLLDKIPDGFFGDKHESDKVDQIQANANNAQMQNMNISPREPEEFTQYVQDAFRQVQPAIEFHDEVMKGITAAVEKIPVLPKIIEQLEEELSRFVFSVIAPFIVPLIRNIKSELMTGSNELINSSEKEQHIVFHDDNSTDPTHSMLSKDHFSNILNEIAGQCAAKTVSWVVPQLMQAIDDDGEDIDRILNRIIAGVMHHPAQRDMGEDGAHEGRRRIYQSVKEWWRDMPDGQREDYRRKLSRNGVERGENHKEGVHDTGHGHGCVGKLKMQKLYGQPDTFEDKIAGAAAGAIIEGVSGVFGSAGGGGGGSGGKDEGGLGGLIGAAGSLFGGAFGGDDDEKKKEKHSSRRDDDDEDKHSNRRRNEEHESSHGSSGRQEHSYSSYGGGEAASYAGGGQEHSQRQESSYGGGGNYGHQEPSHGGGNYGRQEPSHGGGGYGGHQESSYGGGHASSYGRQEQPHSSYGGGEAASYASGGYGQSGHQESNYGGGGNYGRQEPSHGGGNYGHQESSYGGGGYGGRQEPSYGGGASYGREQPSHGHSGRQEQSYGGHSRKKSDDSDDDKKKYHRRKKSSDSDEEKRHRRKKSDSDDSDDEKKQRRRHERKKSGGSDDRNLAYGSGGYNRGGGGGYGGGDSYGGHSQGGYNQGGGGYGQSGGYDQGGGGYGQGGGYNQGGGYGQQGGYNY